MRSEIASMFTHDNTLRSPRRLAEALSFSKKLANHICVRLCLTLSLWLESTFEHVHQIEVHLGSEAQHGQVLERGCLIETTYDGAKGIAQALCGHLGVDGVPPPGSFADRPADGLPLRAWGGGKHAQLETRVVEQAHLSGHLEGFGFEVVNQQAEDVHGASCHVVMVFVSSGSVQACHQGSERVGGGSRQHCLDSGSVLIGRAERV